MTSRVCLWFLPFLFGVSACDCGSTTNGPGSPCAMTAECAVGLVCRDSHCTDIGDGAVRDGEARPDGSVDGGGVDGGCDPARSCRSGLVCCAAGEECVDGVMCAPVCAAVRCGDNHLTCCASAQICLDGVVCAADCAADHALCGAALDTCCDPGQVCTHDTCLTPGMTCSDDYDCLTAGTYCEPTIGHCLPQPPPPLCEVRPSFGAISLAVEWHWTGTTIGTKTYQNVAATPAVGDVSGDGIPDVVVAAYTGSDLNDAILVALSGNDGTLLWTVSGAGAPRATATAAVGNLDPSDDALEVAYKLASGPVRVIDGDGSTVLAAMTTGSANSIASAAPSLADMDHDGNVEVVVGCHVMSFEPMGTGFTLRTRFDTGTCNEAAQGFQSTVVANLDADPELEITTGGVAYNLDGTLLWPASAAGATNGLVAVADLNMDGGPEVVTVHGGTVTVRDATTGTMRVGPGGTWYDATVSIPGGGNGGAPTIADFDGDGLPEIAAAGQGRYAVYDPDCLATPPRTGGDCMPATTNFLRWSSVTQDISSSVTGSSVFDFQGDGVNEAIYNDECWLHIYDGRTGADALDMPHPNSSRTALEYPLVVDVDRDGNSEIVVPANDDQAVIRDNCDDAYSMAFGVPIASLPVEYRTGTHGIFVLGDPGDRWVRTRLVWNEYAYHVTNIDELGTIPMTEADNWTVPGLNDYRTNVQGAGVFNAPNLTVTLDAVAACADAQIRLSAVVTNSGSRGVPAGVLVEISQTMPPPAYVVGSAMTTHALLPGESERVTVTATGVPFDMDLAFIATVDGAMATMPVVECHEDDNTAMATERCTGLM